MYCSKCEYICYENKLGDHTYGAWTAGTGNNHTRTCTECGATEEKAHTWDNGVVNKKPNCASTGVKTYTCTVCDKTKTETIAKTTDHTYGAYINVNETTHKHTCKLCGKEEKKNHVWDNGTITVMPTLDSTGLREIKCKDCGAKKTEVIPKRANGDLNGDTYIDNKDVEYLLWHTLFPSSYPLELFADFDHSSVIDNKDVEYLLWHTLFPDSYPLNANQN